MKEIRNCPSTLAVGYDTYSPTALKRVFDKQKVSHILPYESIEKNEDMVYVSKNEKKTYKSLGLSYCFILIILKASTYLPIPNKPS